MNFALVEDAAIAIPRANDAFDALKAKGLKLEDNYTALIDDEDSFRDYIARVKSMSGPLILCVDRQLGFDRERILAKEYGFADVTRLSGVGEEGVAVAIEAIRNHQIQPLLIVTTSAMGVSDEIHDFLTAIIKQEGRIQNAKAIASIDSRRFTSGTDYSNEIIENAVQQFESLFGDRSYFDEVIEKVREQNPPGSGTAKDNDGHDYADAKWLSLTSTLIAVPVTEVQAAFHKGEQYMGEAYKQLGLCPRFRLSLGTVWLIALSAYRFRHRASRWNELFDPQELVLHRFQLYSCLPEQKRETRQSSLLALYRMFDSVLRKDEKHAPADASSHGPLRKVTLTGSSLTFEFNFPLKLANSDETMAEYLTQRINGAIGRPAAAHHGSTDAVWNFYLHSLLDDHTGPKNYEFPARCSRMSFRSGDQGKTTLLTFGARQG